MLLRAAFAFILILHYAASSEHEVSHKLLAFTVATEETDGFVRFERSVRIWGVEVGVLGKGSEWRGGDVKYGPGGGQKVRLLKEALLALEPTPAPDTVVLFTDSYDVIFLAGSEDILTRFKWSKAKILFGAEQFCWPDVSLQEKYPKVSEGNPYLNSGGFIGFYSEVIRMLSFTKIEDSQDDQLYFTNIYLNETARSELGMKLDHKSQLFQNLNGADSQVEVIDDNGNWPDLFNSKYKSNPVILHGNGVSKLNLNKLGNFLAKSWSAINGCAFCDERKINLNENALPACMLAIFVEHPVPFFAEFLRTIEKLDYPKNLLHIFVHIGTEYHDVELKEFIANAREQYRSVKAVNLADKVSEVDARHLAAMRANTLDVPVLMVDGVARLNSNALKQLLSIDVGVVAPLLVRPERAWSNFWGAISPDGFYQRDNLYMDIVERRLRGLWNMPFINSCYLLGRSVLQLYFARNNNIFDQPGVDSDMAFCTNLRDQGTFMYVSNEESLGHLVDPDTFNTSLTHPDMYQLFENRLEWEQHYLHPAYHDIFLPNRTTEQPCPDVYRFPFVSKQFCTELINIMEAFGQWSDGSNSDSRLPTGYEAVPTRDIQMWQVGLDNSWKTILKDYVWPLQELVFTGYSAGDPSRTFMNFVVRYRPDEQPLLRPHHDSSTFTLNLALNTPEVDYSGGGCRFIRYECTVKDSQPGWVLMHPGRLTHYHEGLLVTNGTRYIMITFADP